jgi:hypothetical protein
MMSQKSLSQKQIAAVLDLAGPERYDHFIKRVVDARCAWGLWNEGWAMGVDATGRATFPLWPASEYASLCAVGMWIEFEPTEITLSDLIDELLPKLLSDGVQPSVFRTPEGDAILPAIPQLLADLENEMSRYE